MKKYLLSLCLAMYAIPLLAQDLKLPSERYRPIGEIAIDAVVASDPSDLYYYFAENWVPGFSAGAVASYRFDDMFRLGLGVEFSSWRLYYPNSAFAGMPVYADLRCNLGGGKVSPFWEGRIGGIICVKKSHEERIRDYYSEIDMTQTDRYVSGVFVNMGFGLSIKRSNISIGAEWFRHKQDYKLTVFHLADQQIQSIETKTEHTVYHRIACYLRYTYSFGL